MKTIDLCGHWEVRRNGTDETFDASVPGCVHTDLLAAGKIPDPFFGEMDPTPFSLFRPGLETSVRPLVLFLADDYGILV